MPAAFCKFTFSEDISKSLVEDTIASAIFLAEYAYGKATVRIDAAYALADDPPRCLIDISSQVGRYIAEELADMMMQLRGERSFDVIKVDRWKL